MNVLSKDTFLFSEKTYLAYTGVDDSFPQLGRHVWCLPALAIIIMTWRNFVFVCFFFEFYARSCCFLNSLFNSCLLTTWNLWKYNLTAILAWHGVRLHCLPLARLLAEAEKSFSSSVVAYYGFSSLAVVKTITKKRLMWDVKQVLLAAGCVLGLCNCITKAQPNVYQYIILQQWGDYKPTSLEVLFLTWGNYWERRRCQVYSL